MSSIQRIKVFEHEILRIGQQGFTKQHWEALLNYRKGSHEAYFQIIHQGIKFSSYVGIIQIGNLCIEILPKIDQHNQNHSLWQQVLIDMLRYCRLLKINQIGTATANARFNSILELYLEVFLNEVRQLLQEGLIKSYSRKEENSLVLKGRLVVPKQMRHNQLSRERFYINYQKYDYNHPLNQIIRQGLNLILTLNTSPIIRQQALQIKAQFPTVNAPKRGIAAPILFHRTTERYRTAVEIVIAKHKVDGHAEKACRLFQVSHHVHAFTDVTGHEECVTSKVADRFVPSRSQWRANVTEMRIGDPGEAHGSNSGGRKGTLAPRSL